MPKWMQALKFNGDKKDRYIRYKRSWFTQPDRHISKLRALARAGRDEMESLRSFEDKKSFAWDESDGVAEITDTCSPLDVSAADEEDQQSFHSDNGRLVTQVDDKSDQELERLVTSESTVAKL
jgi:hypothetical protein